MIRINDKRFLVLGLTIVIASVFLGTFFASRYKTLNVGAVVKSGNACYDKCRIENGREYCNSDCGTDINYLGGNNNGDGINDQSGCGPNEIRCSVTNQKGEGVSICAPNSATSCNEAAIDQGISVMVGSGGIGSGGYLCREGQGRDYNYIPGNPLGCVLANSIQNLGQGKPPSCFCGTIQIDGGDYAGTYKSTCGCGNNDQEPNPTPNPTPTVTPTTTPINTPTSTPTPTTTPTNSPTPTNTPIPTPTPTGVPNSCNGTCGSNTNCQGGLFCLLGSGQTSGYCRNPECAQESDCNCKSTSTPPAVLGQTAPPALPKTGGSVVSQISLVGLAVLGFYLFRKFRLN
ncbi:MAG: LPXTG cell wall anchor domain-containing protein [Microgenomates group bacterium]